MNGDILQNSKANYEAFVGIVQIAPDSVENQAISVEEFDAAYIVCMQELRRMSSVAIEVLKFRRRNEGDVSSLLDPILKVYNTVMIVSEYAHQKSMPVAKISSTSKHGRTNKFNVVKNGARKLLLTVVNSRRFFQSRGCPYGKRRVREEAKNWFLKMAQACREDVEKEFLQFIDAQLKLAAGKLLEKSSEDEGQANIVGAGVLRPSQCSSDPKKCAETAEPDFDNPGDEYVVLTESELSTRAQDAAVRQDNGFTDSASKPMNSRSIDMNPLSDGWTSQKWPCC